MKFSLLKLHHDFVIVAVPLNVLRNLPLNVEFPEFSKEQRTVAAPPIVEFTSQLDLPGQIIKNI